MLKYRFIKSLVVLIIFASVSLSMADVGSDGSNTGSPSSAPKLLKVMGIVENITGNTLCLTNNKKYNLRNVKVTYIKGKGISEKKKTAEMLFINDVLQEVVIR
jgi:hypothetical protein